MNETRLRELADRFLAELAADAAGSEPGPVYDTDRLTTLSPAFAGITEEDLAIEGPHGPVKLRRYSPTSAPTGTIVWIHGGAFVYGDLDIPEAHWVSLTLAQHGFEIISVGYPKALEGVHFPTPADHVHAAWQWAAAHARGATIQLGGASAGGAYAAGLVVRLLSQGDAAPSSVALVYPIVHPELPEASEELKVALQGHPQLETFTPDLLAGMNYNFAGSLDALADPVAFAGLAGPNVLAAFPPTRILNSEHDFLRASGEKFAAQLRNAGVDVQCVTEPTSFHGQLNEPESPLGQRSVARLAEWFEGAERHS